MSWQAAMASGKLPVGPSDESLAQVIGLGVEGAASMTTLSRRAHPYQSTFPVEEIRIECSDSSVVELLFKDLSPDRVPRAIRETKPAFLSDPVREIRVYQRLLAELDLGTAKLRGWHIDESAGRYWLFLEHIRGPLLTEVGDVEVWRGAARWLARMHAAVPSDRIPEKVRERLLRHDADWYRAWMDRARRFGPIRRRADLERLARGQSRILDELLDHPVAFIHGEFHPSNLVVRANGPRGRVCPVDWEMAGIGPVLTDLAALVSGDWDPMERDQVVSAYREECRAHGGRDVEPAAFDRALGLCRLQLSIQWLGWSQDWAPPAAHRYGWLDEALRLTEELNP